MLWIIIAVFCCLCVLGSVGQAYAEQQKHKRAKAAFLTAPDGVEYL